MNKKELLLLLSVNSIINTIAPLQEYLETCPNDQKDIFISMLASLKNMGNALCDIAEDKDINNENADNIPEEIMLYIKEIKEEIQRDKIDE